MRMPGIGVEPAPLGDPFAHLTAVVRGEGAVAPADASALANNVTVARLLDAARESARTGRTVRLEASYRGQSQPKAPAVTRP